MALPRALAPHQFGSLLRQIRIEAGLTQEALAERASLGVRSIQGLEQGESQPRLETLRRLVDALSLSGVQREHFEAAVSPTPRHAGPIDPRRPSALPLGDASTPGTNLPVQLTSFVGRERERAEVKRLLGASRLVTLTGTGGCGKTRLAYQVAADLLDGYPDGVWVAELASLSDPELVPQTVAFALGIREQPGQPILETVVSYLRSKCLLVVLDNCEHLLGACARLADSVLHRCPHLAILATSREAMCIAGETSYRVPSLSLPDVHNLPSLERLTQYEAVMLFVERAAAVLPSFGLADQNALSVAQVCWRLDGIPLALELAAARVRGLGVEQLAARLDDRFRLLTSGSRTALRRQQTLRATIDWSHDLLSAAERVLFRRLGVFVGGWTLEAAEAICQGGDVEDREVVDLLLRLVDRSLAVADTERQPVRYSLLETIRQYAQEKLFESGEGATVRDRHLEWYLALAEREARELSGQYQGDWVARLDQEEDNLRAALDWSLARDEDASRAMGLAAALGAFWNSSRRVTAMRQQLGPVLARAGGELGARLSTLTSAAIAESLAGHWRRAREWHEEALTLARESGDRRLIAHALLGLSWVPSDLGDYVEARLLQEEALSLAREAGDRHGIAEILTHLMSTLYQVGDDSTARLVGEEGLALCRDLGLRDTLAPFMMVTLGRVAIGEGDLGHARDLAEAALALARGARTNTVPQALRLLGDVARAEGDHLSSEMNYRAALAACQEMAGQRLFNTSYVVSLAGVWVAEGCACEAARLYGAVHRWLGSVGMPVPWYPPRGYQRDEAAAREALGEDAFARAFSEGQAMTLEQAVEYALSDDAEALQASAGSQSFPSTTS